VNVIRHHPALPLPRLINGFLELLPVAVLQESRDNDHCPHHRRIMPSLQRISSQRLMLADVDVLRLGLTRCPFLSRKGLHR